MVSDPPLRAVDGVLVVDAVDRVESVGIHQFALCLLNRRGVGISLNGLRAEAAFKAGRERVGAPRASRDVRDGRALLEEGDPERHQGRGITRFGQYADLQSAGGTYRLTLDQRREV